LPELIDRIDSLISELRPSLVISPAYEGGHPDHDAAVFAVALVRQMRKCFRHLEFPLYHADENGGIITGEFISLDPAEAVELVALAPAERDLKSRMLSCFVTQERIL